MVTYYTRPFLAVINKRADLKMLNIKPSLLQENCAIITEYSKRCDLLMLFINEQWNNAVETLERKNKEKAECGFKIKPISERDVIVYLFNEALKRNIWNSDKIYKFEKNSSLVYVKSRNLYYEAGNNHCVDFYELGGKVGWEVIKRFDANQKDFIPQWKKDGGKAIWSVQQGDMLELDTPDKWKTLFNTPRCYAKVKKFSAGLSLIPFNSTNDDFILLDRGLSFCIESNMRKIELTPFGKIKKKHKVLWDGKKN